MAWRVKDSADGRNARASGTGGASFTASPDGTVSVMPSIDPADCGKVLQAVGLASCEPSNVEMLP